MHKKYLPFPIFTVKDLKVLYTVNRSRCSTGELHFEELSGIHFHYLFRVKSLQIWCISAAYTRSVSLTLNTFSQKMLLLWKACKVFACQTFKRLYCKCLCICNNKRNTNQILNFEIKIFSLAQLLCQLNSTQHKELRLFCFQNKKEKWRKQQQQQKSRYLKTSFCRMMHKRKRQYCAYYRYIIVPKHSSPGNFTKLFQ